MALYVLLSVTFPDRYCYASPPSDPASCVARVIEALRAPTWNTAQGDSRSSNCGCIATPHPHQNILLGVPFSATAISDYWGGPSTCVKFAAFIQQQQRNILAIPHISDCPFYPMISSSCAQVPGIGKKDRPALQEFDERDERCRQKQASVADTMTIQRQGALPADSLLSLRLSVRRFETFRNPEEDVLCTGVGRQPLLYSNAPPFHSECACSTICLRAFFGNQQYSADELGVCRELRELRKPSRSYDNGLRTDLYAQLRHHRSRVAHHPRHLQG